jgi:ribosomal protein S18 acetylase RimI-like enzyme
MRMGRLAVSSEDQGNGYGELLLVHAVNRSLALRADLRVREMLVDALHDRAAAF